MGISVDNSKVKLNPYKRLWSEFSDAYDEFLDAFEWSDDSFLSR